MQKVEYNVDAIKRIPIVELTSTHYGVQYRKTGNVYKARCPFHPEDTASFAAYEDTNKFNCFGGSCGVQGDVIDFVRKFDGIAFDEACAKLSHWYNIPVTTREVNQFHAEYIAKMTSHMNRYMSYMLGSPAYAYAISRGINVETMQKFCLGYSPENEYQLRSDKGGINNKLVFPIMENYPNGSPLAFGYRDLSPDYTGDEKYTNDRNQDGGKGQNLNYSGVFTKSEILYGMNLARANIRKCNYAIITEGFMDVISMHQSGLENTVGTMGCNLSKRHIELLRGLTNNILLFYDGDEPGITAMSNHVPILYKNGFNVVVVLSEGGKDPADLCFSFGFNGVAITNYIRSIQCYGFEFLSKGIIDNYSRKVNILRMDYVRNMYKVLEDIADPTSRRIFEDIINKNL